MNLSLNQILAKQAKGALRRAAVSGGMAGLLSLMTLMIRGHREAGRPAAPVNAPSQWVHGKKALHADHVDIRHTVTGVVIHQASALFWGVLFDQLWLRASGRDGTKISLPALTAGAAGLTAVAALVDLKLVPDRLTPGFQKRLSNKGVALVYASFAVGLAAGAVLAAHREERGRP